MTTTRAWPSYCLLLAGKGAGFEAALDAASGRLWPREPIGENPHPGNYASQRRWIERDGRLLGLSSAVPRRVSEAIGEVLGVPGLQYRVARQYFMQAVNCRDRGRAVVSVLAELDLDDDGLFARFLAAGCRSGSWNRAWLFDVSRNRRISPFSAAHWAIRPPP